MKVKQKPHPVLYILSFLCANFGYLSCQRFKNLKPKKTIFETKNVAQLPLHWTSDTGGGKYLGRVPPCSALHILGTGLNIR
jgi:hypothetical protein